MRADELLSILQEEFDGCRPEIDAMLAAWRSDPAAGPDHARALQALMQRMSAACLVIGLEGMAQLFDWIGATGHELAGETRGRPAGAALGTWLTWLGGWHEALARYCRSREGDDAASAIVDYVARSPRPMRLTELHSLAEALRKGPSLPPEEDDEQAAGDADATDDDVSLALPADVDTALLEVFVQESPAHLARLAAVTQAMLEGKARTDEVLEAQRVAHTFKGSGNIIGIRGVARLAHRLEDVLAFAANHPLPAAHAMLHDLQQAVACLDQMVYALRGDEQPPADAQHWMQRMIDWDRTIRAGDFDAGLEPAAAVQEAPVSAAAPTPVAAAAPIAMVAPPSPAQHGNRHAAPTAVPAPAPAAEADPTAMLRVPLALLERLVRRASQQLVLHGRLSEHLRLAEQRMAQLMATNDRLQQHLRSLEIALDHQAVSLQETASESGVTLDPLEMDRYTELHELTRFATEMAADEHEHAQGARAELEKAMLGLRKHGTDLREQHREMNQARLVPVRNIVPRLRRTVAQTAAATGKQVRLEVQGEHVQLDSATLERLTEPLLHLLRNAVDHGIEKPDDRALLDKPAEGVIRLGFERDGSTVRIETRDDGLGLDLGAIHSRARQLGLLDVQAEPSADELTQMILLPGFSTRDEITEISGRGMGLDVVAERLRGLKGSIAISTEPLAGTTFSLAVPSSSGIEYVLMVEVAQQQYALPASSVVQVLPAGDGGIEGGELVHGKQRLQRVWLGTLLGLPQPDDLDTAPRPHVVVRSTHGETAFAVDRALDAREVVLQDVGNFLLRVPGVGSGLLRPDGGVTFTLDVEALASPGTPWRRVMQQHLSRREPVARKRVLVVDDAISVRKSLQQLVGDAGYEVLLARDGQDALDVLSQQPVNIVLTDLEMPRLNGLELAQRMRGSPRFASTPIVMITSRSSAKHRALATNAGVDVLLTKPHSEEELLHEVRRLVA